MWQLLSYVLEHDLRMFYNFQNVKITISLVLFAVIEGEYYYLHFTDVKTEVQIPEPLYAQDCHPRLHYREYRRISGAFLWHYAGELEINCDPVPGLEGLNV